jgi:hypothetical protein
MFTKPNLYNLLLTVSHPQVLRFALLVLVVLASASRGVVPPTLTCDLTCGGTVGG